LPNDGLTGQLKDRLKLKFEEINRILLSENFFEEAVALNDYATEIENEVATTCENFKHEQNENIKLAIAEIKEKYEWGQLNEEQKQEFSARLDNAFIKDKNGIKGIREIITEVYSFNNSIKNINNEIQEAIKPVLSTVGESENIRVEDTPKPKKSKPVSLIHIPKRIQKKQDVEIIIQTFTNLKDNWNDDEIIDIKW
jgi:hypothetical protein